MHFNFELNIPIFMVTSVRPNATVFAEQGPTCFVSEVKRSSIKLNGYQRKCFLEHAKTWPPENLEFIQGRKHF